MKKPLEIQWNCEKPIKKKRKKKGWLWYQKKTEWKLDKGILGRKLRREQKKRKKRGVEGKKRKNEKKLREKLENGKN